jgi:hypothetical protein
MFHRITGGLLVAIGLLIGVVGLYGWMHTDVMARMFSEFSEVGAFHGAVFKPALWSSHWRLANLVIAGMGCSTAVAGLMLMLKKPWGYLVLFGTFVFAGTYPLILRMSGYAQYKWEGGSIRGGLPYMAVALIALLVYIVVVRRQRAGVDR